MAAKRPIDAHDTAQQPSGDGPEYSITFGRQLIDGKPTGEGITLPVDSPVFELLEQAVTPLLSNPVLSEFGVGIVLSEHSNGEYARGLDISPPGNEGPAEHIHPSYDEHFEVVEGEFAFEIDGARRTLGAGETLVVNKGTPHTYRNESDAVAVCLVEARPAGRIEEVLTTLFGLSHDGKIRANGQPGFWQGMVLAEALGGDTVFTSPPPVVQNLLAAVLGRVGRLLGYRASYPKYERDSFWIEHVEQPPQLQMQ